MLLLFWVNPYKQLSLFPEADTVRRKLFQEFDLVARQLDQGPPQNPFVTLRDGELHLKRPDALEVPERIHGLRQTKFSFGPPSKGVHMLGRVVKDFSSSNASKRSQFVEHGRDQFRNGWMNVHCPLHYGVRRLSIH